MPSLVTNPAWPPEASPFSKIFATIRPRLATITGIDESYIYPVANDRYKIVIAEPFFLYFQAFGPEPFADTGGGRLNAWVTRRIRVYIYTRSGVDIVGTDETALEGPNAVSSPDTGQIGQFYAEELVYSALFNWMPLDTDTGKALCTEPLHPANGSGPAIRKDEDAAGLIRTNLDFSCRYNLYIPAADPPP